MATFFKLRLRVPRSSLEATFIVTFTPRLMYYQNLLNVRRLVYWIQSLRFGPQCQTVPITVVVNVFLDRLS